MKAGNVSTDLGAVERTIGTPRPAAPLSGSRDPFADQLRLRAVPPAIPAGFVPRPRLHQLLTEGRQHPITLISAGPGCGKTLTVASWARGAGRPDRLAWLSLDDTDNDLREFWADVVGALAISGAVPPGSAILDLSPSVGFGIQEARLGCAALATLPATVTLVLDDLHRITDPVVLRSLGELLEHQPPQLRLVLATRFDPPLRLHRLRLNGDVLDVHSSDLAFTETEAGALFAVQGVDLSPDELTGVWQRTQGWAAGLRLALMSLNSTDVQAGVSKFTGSTPLVAEYLIEEVLDQLPDVDRHFLLAASTVDRICASLATELTGRPDSQLILEGLAAKHALVVGLAGRNDWFRLHPLLQEMLQHRLALERPELVVELHARASRWFETQGEPVAAIRHACLAGHWDEVGRLAAQAVPLLVTARAGAFVAALEPAVARAAATPTTSCLLASAMTHYHRHDYESMARDVRTQQNCCLGSPRTIANPRGSSSPPSARSRSGRRPGPGRSDRRPSSRSRRPHAPVTTTER